MIAERLVPPQLSANEKERDIVNKFNVRSILPGVLRLVLPLFVLLIIQASANAQGYTPNEQACYDMVQGKVAYDRAGNKNWLDTNLRRLCKGTANPTATIDCFSQRVSSYNDWERGLRECTAAALGTGDTNKVVRDTSGQAPPNSTFCANDFQACTFDGEREVIYGANGVFVRKVIKGGSVCLPATFGVEDPVPNVLKSCYVVNATPKVVRDTTTNVQPPVDNGMVTRIVTIRNKSGMFFDAYLRDRTNYTAANDAVALKVFARTQNIMLGETKTVGENIRTPVTKAIEFWIRESNDPVPMFKASLPYGAGAPTSFCYEITGTYFVPTAKACDNGPTYESSYIAFRNEAGFNSTMSLTYYPTGGGSVKIAKTRSTTPGYQTKLYLPMDADTDKQMTLAVRADARGTDYLTRDVGLQDFDSAGTTCYKAWGSIATPKVSQCVLDPNARKIKFWNNAGFAASLHVLYYDKNAAGQDVARQTDSNTIELTQTETIAVPMGTSTKPVTVSISRDVGGVKTNFYSAQVRADFTGELCYKAEGIVFAPTASTCDNAVGDTTDPNTRQIRFQNDSGFDASLIVTYFVDQMINGVKVPMAKTLATGMINGLGGKFRLVTIPKKTSAGMPVTIAIQGSTTLRNDIFSTTLPANFAASPQPCFKVWGTAFDPQGGKCDQ